MYNVYTVTTLCTFTNIPNVHLIYTRRMTPGKSYARVFCVTEHMIYIFYIILTCVFTRKPCMVTPFLRNRLCLRVQPTQKTR